MLKKNVRNSSKYCCLFFLILCGLTSGVVPDHALYIGVVQIIHKEAESLTTVQVKIFSDDLQSVLQNDLGYEQVPSVTALCETTFNPIESYFENLLEIKINQEVLVLQLVNCEQINDVHLLTFKADQMNDWRTCSINAPFFMELFPLQSNIINFKYIPINASPIQKMDRVVKGNSVLEITL